MSIFRASTSIREVNDVLCCNFSTIFKTVCDWDHIINLLVNLYTKMRSISRNKLLLM